MSNEYDLDEILRRITEADLEGAEALLGDAGYQGGPVAWVLDGPGTAAAMSRLEGAGVEVLDPQVVGGTLSQWLWGPQKEEPLDAGNRVAVDGAALYQVAIHRLIERWRRMGRYVAYLLCEEEVVWPWGFDQTNPIRIASAAEADVRLSLPRDNRHLRWSLAAARRAGAVKEYIDRCFQAGVLRPGAYLSLELEAYGADPGHIEVTINWHAQVSIRVEDDADWPS